MLLILKGARKAQGPLAFRTATTTIDRLGPATTAAIAPTKKGAASHGKHKDSGAARTTAGAGGSNSASSTDRNRAAEQDR